jgi:hypothetical protein
MRIGRLRCYGNAINAIQATEFIKAFMAEIEKAPGVSASEA